MEEGGGTEPGVLQNGIQSQNTPVADGSSRRWKQLKEENTERTRQVQITKHSLVFLEGTQLIRAHHYLHETQPVFSCENAQILTPSWHGPLLGSLLPHKHGLSSQS